MLVVGCLRGTPAALAGVGYGDILLSVNGRRTRNFADYLHEDTQIREHIVGRLSHAGLSDITIPDSVTSIGYAAFDFCMCKAYGLPTAKK